MKRTLVVLLGIFLLAAIGCTGERGSDADAGTVKPATPPAASDSETVPTQTIEIGEERSAAEGGVLTDSETGMSTETTATSTTATQTTTQTTTAP